MTTELRTVGDEAFEDVYPLLAGFPTKGMSKEDWRRMLFHYRWSDKTQRGYAIYENGKAVGFLGTIWSTRFLAGKTEKVCSLSSWIVLPEHRDASLKLVMPLLRIKDATILNPTPSPVAYDIFKKLGFTPLEGERYVLPPVSGLRESAASLRGSFTRAPSELVQELTPDELRVYEDLSSCPVADHVLLRRGARRCYLVATPVHRRHIPFVEIQYIGDREFFWEHRLLAHAALAVKNPAAALWVDRRFGPRKPPLFAVTRTSRRLYRPTRKEIVPEMIDGLYSELMGLKW